MKTMIMGLMSFFVVISAFAGSKTVKEDFYISLSPIQKQNCPERFFIDSNGKLDLEKLGLCMAFSDLGEVSWELIRTPSPPFQIEDQSPLADWTGEIASIVRDILRAVPAGENSSKLVEANLTNEIKTVQSSFQKIEEDLFNGISLPEMDMAMRELLQKTQVAARKLQAR